MSTTRGERIYDVLRLVRPLTLLSARVVTASLGRHELTVGGRAILELLVDRGPATVPALAETLDVSRQAVQRLVDDLRSQGYAEPRANPAHRRSVLIAATEAGTRAFTGIHDDEVAQLGRMLAGVPDRDVATTVRVLSALRDDVRRRASELDGAS